MNQSYGKYKVEVFVQVVHWWKQVYYTLCSAQLLYTYSSIYGNNMFHGGRVKIDQVEVP